MIVNEQWQQQPPLERGHRVEQLIKNSHSINLLTRLITIRINKMFVAHDLIAIKWFINDRLLHRSVDRLAVGGSQWVVVIEWEWNE